MGNVKTTQQNQALSNLLVAKVSINGIKSDLGETTAFESLPLIYNKIDFLMSLIDETISCVKSI